MLNDLNLHMYRAFLFQQVEKMFTNYIFFFKRGLLSKVFFNFLSEMCSYALYMLFLFPSVVKV